MGYTILINVLRWPDGAKPSGRFSYTSVNLRCKQGESFAKRHACTRTWYIGYPLHRSAPCGTLMGCRVFQPHVSPTFALSQAFPASPTTWPYRPRARDRGRRGGDVAKENNLLLESSTDSVNGRTTAAPRRLDRGAAVMLLYLLFGYRFIRPFSPEKQDMRPEESGYFLYSGFETGQKRW